MKTVCPECAGTGEAEDEECPWCDGTGWTPDDDSRFIDRGDHGFWIPGQVYTGTADLTGWTEVGMLSEDGSSFDREAPEHRGIDFGATRTVEFTPEFTRNFLKLWGETKPAVDITKIKEQAEPYRKVEQALHRELLLQRLNTRWRDHMEPGHHRISLAHSGSHRFYPNARITPTATGYTVVPIPAPALDDPDYYLRNP